MLGVILVYLMFLPIQRISQLYTQIKDQKQELITDTLTRTYNYKYLEQVLHDKVKAKELFSLIFIDIDEFKKINDTYGHTAGNYLLQKFVDMIKPKMERESILCRYGGDEFCIITKDRQTAEKTAHNILMHNNEYYIQYYEDDIKIPLSIGIYNHRSIGKSALDIIEEADMAMYKAKKMGGNRIVRCN
jgi:diguanylate cyclase